MKYRELQLILKAYRDTDKNPLMNGFKLNQRTDVLRAKYLEVLNDQRKSLGQPEHKLTDIFPVEPPKPVVITLKELKARILAEIGAPLATAQIREYFGNITYHYDASHKDYPLDFTKRSTWDILKQYTTKIAKFHKDATEPKKEHTQTLSELVRDKYKFSAEINLKSA